MSNRIKAIFFDIDGTLRDFETGRIPDTAKESLALAREAGVKLFIATGRHLLEMEEENLLEGLEFDGYVTLNGQYCYRGDEVVFKNPIAEADVRTMVDMAERAHFPCMFMEADCMYLNMVDELVIRAQEMISTAVPPVRDITRAIHKDIYQMIPYAGAELEARILKELTSCDSTRWSADSAFDLTPKGGDKCLGIQKMLDAYGIRVEEMAAVGDGHNDVTMLSYAGVGVAMGNGCDEAREAADYVTDRIEKDGLRKAVLYLLNI